MFTLRKSSPDIRRLTDRLLATTIGETATYTALSATIGVDILQRRYLIMRAIKLANREAGALFQCVYRTGYKRLPAEQAASFGGHARKRIRSTARRASTTMGRALETANAMPNDALLAATRELSVLGMIQHLTTERVVRSVPDDVKPLPVGQVMLAVADQLKLLPRPGK